MAKLNDIVENLELMCDKRDPQDKKILLLARLVSERCDQLSEHQRELTKSLQSMDSKIDTLTNLFTKYAEDRKSCPVYNKRAAFEMLGVFLTYPRITILSIIGSLAIILLAILTGTWNVIDLFK